MLPGVRAHPALRTGEKEIALPADSALSFRFIEQSPSRSSNCSHAITGVHPKSRPAGVRLFYRTIATS